MNFWVITARKDTPQMTEKVGPFPTRKAAQEWAERYEREAGDKFVAVVKKGAS